VSLSKYLILQFLDVRHTDLSFVPQHTLVIFRKTMRLLLLDIMLHLPRSSRLPVDFSVYPRVE
jgi:hypothetical protein